MELHETIWLVLVIVLAIVESFTISMVAVWFALGSLVALLASLLGAPLSLQITLCIVTSAVLLFFTRPLAQKYVNSKRISTNADRNIGMLGVVTEEIDNVKATGSVIVAGKDWTARSKSGEAISAQSQVIVRSIEGVKLIVEAEPALIKK